MEEKKPQQPEPNLCEECNTNASRYKCPGCSLRTCSLICVNSHKQRTACTGKRPLTNFVPISQFDDNQLVSVYNMLEEVKRVADSAKRMRVTVCGYPHFRLPNPLKYLRGAAQNRRIIIVDPINKPLFYFFCCDVRSLCAQPTSSLAKLHRIVRSETMLEHIMPHLRKDVMYYQHPWNRELELIFLEAIALQVKYGNYMPGGSWDYNDYAVSGVREVS